MILLAFLTHVIAIIIIFLEISRGRGSSVESTKQNKRSPSTNEGNGS